MKITTFFSAFSPHPQDEPMSFYAIGKIRTEMRPFGSVIAKRALMYWEMWGKQGKS